ncbi:TB2/DP1, HVA22 family [Dictyocaulus viviparus]|uniref:Receptor expression-enhancing protein n=1 Tax=Dictyocaulus viviparus TaxID=29172 RepID=A0A0D8XFA0_DICVI|nr:TB2/DP1, HVA22 family [Dictyocaulus viviparus]
MAEVWFSFIVLAMLTRGNSHGDYHSDVIPRDRSHRCVSHRSCRRNSSYSSCYISRKNDYHVTQRLLCNLEYLNGFQTAHDDFITFLYGDHGGTYNNYIRLMETTLIVTREKISYGLFGLLATYLVFGSGAQFVCNMVGVTYPAYITVKVIRTNGGSDDVKWLIYWSVFAIFTLFDSFSQLFPLYWLVKMLFLVYLYLPQTQGATYIFYNYVNPLVNQIDRCTGMH